MQINPGIFKGYDIRAIYPTDINEETIVPIITATVSFFQKKIQKETPLLIVLGRDMRVSSPSLFAVAKKTLVDLGVHVIDAGLLSTPTLYFTVFHYGYDAGIQISASHNPKEYNGIKIVQNSPGGLIKIGRSTGLEDIKKMAMEGTNANGSLQKPTPGQVTEKTNILEDEVANALKITENPDIKKFKIVADAANAMGAQYIDALFKKVPGEIIRMNFDLDGTFPAHQPDPLQKETLVELQKKVVKENADLGLAPDGDGDRLFFIDEKGNVVPPTIITSIVAKELLKTHPNETFYIDIRYLLTPKKIIEENGGKMIVTKVGHAYITEAMHQTHGIFAGESSGHYFFRETGNAENQLPIILTVLKVLTEENNPFSEVIKEYQRSFESGEINYEVKNAQEILKKLQETYIDGTLNDMDGIAVDYPDWRFSVRTSNTEPLLRLNVEALEEKTMLEKRDELQAFMQSIKK